MPELHLPGLLSLDLSANYLADLDCAALENLAQARTHCNRNWKQIFPEKELHSHSPNFRIHVSVSNLYIITIDLPILLQEISGPILGINKSLTDT